MDIDTKRLTKKIVIDFLCVFAVGLPILIFRVFGKSFKRGFFCDDLSIRYPFHPSTVPDYGLYIIGFVLPISVMCSFEYMISRKTKNRPAIFLFGWKIPHWVFRSYRVVGVFCFGAACAQLLTDIGKYSIGRLRPNFFDVCKPDINCNDDSNRFRYIEYGTFSCNGTDAKLLRESRLSFPSGHSSFSAYTMIYLALYIQSRLNWRGSYLFKHLLQFFFACLSWITALSRISDNKHHWSDVLVGLIIGTTVAFLNANFVSDLFRSSKIKKNLSETTTLTSTSHQVMMDTNNIPTDL